MYLIRGPGSLEGLVRSWGDFGVAFWRQAFRVWGFFAFALIHVKAPESFGGP